VKQSGCNRGKPQKRLGAENGSNTSKPLQRASRGRPEELMAESCRSGAAKALERQYEALVETRARPVMSKGRDTVQLRPAALTATLGRTASAAPSSSSRITASRSAQCRGLRSRNCRRTSGGWAGASPGRHRSTATGGERQGRRRLGIEQGRSGRARPSRSAARCRGRLRCGRPDQPPRGAVHDRLRAGRGCAVVRPASTVSTRSQRKRSLRGAWPWRSRW
jgi:hypothetical protein